MKILKNPIFMFILGIITASTVALAAGIKAEDIEYDSTHSVKDKIDDLYTISSTWKNLSTTTTVVPNKMLNGFTAYDNNGNLVTGNIPTYNGTTIFNASYSNQTAQTAGKYVADDIVINGMASTYKNLTTTTDVAANALLYNVVAYNSSGQTVTGSIQTYNGDTIVTSGAPGTSAVTLNTSGKYMDSNITVNPIPSTYKNLTTSTTATASDLLNGKTAYDSNGDVIVGTYVEDTTAKSGIILSANSWKAGTGWNNTGLTKKDYIDSDYFTYTDAGDTLTVKKACRVKAKVTIYNTIAPKNESPKYELDKNSTAVLSKTGNTTANSIVTNTSSTFSLAVGDKLLAQVYGGGTNASYFVTTLTLVE